MDESVEPVCPLYVHQAALTTVNVPDDDGAMSLVPMIGVWADLSPMIVSGFIVEPRADERTMPIAVITDSVLDPTNPAIMNVVLAQARPDDDEDVTEDSMPVAVFGPHWSIRVPTSWVAMATVIMGTPLQLRMVLINGQPPATPEHAIVSLSECGAVVLPTPAGVQETITPVMGELWASPVPVVSHHHHEVPVPNLMRDQLWTITSGIALGQEHALNRAATFAEYVATLNGGDAEEQAKHDDLMDVAQWAAESAHGETVLRDANGHVAWPEAMRPLVEKIAEMVDETAFAGYDQGLFFDDAVDSFGMRAALLALCVNLATKTASVIDSSASAGVTASAFSPSYLLGVWMDPASDDPWWASRATHPLLLHHDTGVLTDLLACNPTDASRGEVHGPLTFRYLHVVTEALASLDVSPDEFKDLLKNLDVTPPRFEDMVHVATRLISVASEETDSDNDECPGCVAVNRLVAETVDQRRLIAAAAGLLPLLADVDAQQAALPVGDEEWKNHRAAYLMHWLDHTALTPLGQD